MTQLEMHLSKLYRIENIRLPSLLEALDEELQTKDEVFAELKKILGHLNWSLESRNSNGS